MYKLRFVPKSKVENYVILPRLIWWPLKPPAPTIYYGFSFGVSLRVGCVPWESFLGGKRFHRLHDMETWQKYPMFTSSLNHIQGARLTWSVQITFTCQTLAAVGLDLEVDAQFITRLALLARPVFFTCLFKAHGQLVCKLAYASDTYGVS